ncbi:MAG: FlgD immunoglobulin-like domain containing protein [Candidatus Krumholzibacteriia bacterium]
MRIVLSTVMLGVLVGLATAATLHVPAQYATVQAGVSAAAAGDTVQVAAGVYQEQVVITVALVLRGAGADLTTIEAPPAMPHAVGAAVYRAIVCVDNAGGPVTVSDLTIDGLARQPASGRFVGLMFYKRGGVVRNVTVHDLHHTPADAMASGIGVLASLDAPATNPALRLEDVTVTAFQKAGVVVASRGQAVVMTRVSVDAQGVVTQAVPNGIELVAVNNAVLTDCTITGVSHNGLPNSSYTASGLLAVNCTGLMVDGATVSGCLAGVYLEGTAGSLYDLTVDQPAASLTDAHGLVSVTGPIETAASGLPAPRPTLAGPVTLARSGLEVYEVTVRDSEFLGSQLAGSQGLALNTFSARAQKLILERCRVTGWDSGLRAGEDPTLFGAVFGRFSGCRIADNLTAGISSDTITPLDARGCLWGDPSGPYHPTSNPDGLGNPVSDHVLFDPWLTGNLAPLPLPQKISLADFDGLAYRDTISVEYLGGGDEPLYGFSARLGWDPALITSIDVQPPSRGAFAGASWFFSDPGPGSIQVDAALGGFQDGIVSGPLFTVTFQAVGSPDGQSGQLGLELLQARDKFNQPIGGLAADPGVMIVDLHPPVITSVQLVNETLDHTDEYAKDGDQVSVQAVITDGNPEFGRGDIRGVGAPIFGAPWVFGPPDTYDGTLAVWHARTVLTEPVGNGVRSFQVSAIDPVGNPSALAEDSITIDNIRPTAATGVTATPGHNLVALAWDPAADHDLNYRRTVVRANAWGDYPAYATAAPAYPAGVAAGDSVYTGLDTSVVQTFAADGSGRDILYYSVLVEDQAGNVSPVEAGSRARSPSYRVGDVVGAGPGSPGDGLIDAADLARLDLTLGRATGDAAFDPECDLAPADSAGVVIPVPDTAVDLDDLMLIAMRHDHGRRRPRGRRHLPGAVDHRRARHLRPRAHRHLREPQGPPPGRRRRRRPVDPPARRPARRPARPLVPQPGPRRLPRLPRRPRTRGRHRGHRRAAAAGGRPARVAHGRDRRAARRPQPAARGRGHRRGRRSRGARRLPGQPALPQPVQPQHHHRLRSARPASGPAGYLQPRRAPRPPPARRRPAGRPPPGALGGPRRRRPRAPGRHLPLPSGRRPVVGHRQAGAREMTGIRRQLRTLLLVAVFGAAAPAAQAAPVLRWDQAPQKLLVGEETTLRVMLDDTLRVRTFELRVTFHADLILSVAGEPGALFDGLDVYPGFSLTGDGAWYGYCVVLGADDWAEGPGELFRWTVRALAEGTAPVVTVDLGLRPPGGGDYPDAELPGAYVDIGDLTAASATPGVPAVLSLYPNPFNPRARVELAAAADGAGRLVVVDLRGRLVDTAWQGAWQAGRLTVGWDGRDARGAEAPSGVYVFQLLDAGGRRLDAVRGVLAR